MGGIRLGTERFDLDVKLMGGKMGDACRLFDLLPAEMVTDYRQWETAK